MSKFAILWLCCAMMTGALLFKTSQHVTDGRQRLENITAEMRSEEDTLRVLQAEWSYLNQPERLEKLAAQYLKLAPMKGRQFIAAADIPLRPAAALEPAALADTFAAVDAAAAETLTPTTNMAETSAAAPAVAVPLRKPAGLRLPAAYAAPALTPTVPKAAAAKQPVQNQKAAAADNAAVRRDFLDVLDSLGSGGAR
jgi:cell division protein FtsL